MLAMSAIKALLNTSSKERSKPEALLQLHFSSYQKKARKIYCASQPSYYENLKFVAAIGPSRNTFCLALISESTTEICLQRSMILCLKKIIIKWDTLCFYFMRMK